MNEQINCPYCGRKETLKKRRALRRKKGSKSYFLHHECEAGHRFHIPYTTDRSCSIRWRACDCSWGGECSCRYFLNHSPRLSQQLFHNTVPVPSCSASCLTDSWTLFSDNWCISPSFGVFPDMQRLPSCALEALFWPFSSQQFVKSFTVPLFRPNQLFTFWTEKRPLHHPPFPHPR